MRLLNGNEHATGWFLCIKTESIGRAHSILCFYREIASCKLNVGSSRSSLTLSHSLLPYNVQYTDIFSRHMKLYALMRRQRRKYTAHSYNAHQLGSRSAVYIIRVFFVCCSSVLYFGFYSFCWHSVCMCSNVNKFGSVIGYTSISISI